MDNEPQNQPTSELRGSSPRPSPRVRLPGYEEEAWSRRRADDWQDYDNRPPRGYRGYPRDSGVRTARRTSTWTAAALIAGVAVTTGYLAHSMPSYGGSASTGTSTTAPTKSPGTVSPGAPAAHSPVVTSGGSGAAGGGGG